MAKGQSFASYLPFARPVTPTSKWRILKGVPHTCLRRRSLLYLVLTRVWCLGSGTDIAVQSCIAPLPCERAKRARATLAL